MAIALLVGSRSPPSRHKPHPLRLLPTLYLPDHDLKSPGSTSSSISSTSSSVLARAACSMHSLVLLCLIVVVVVATRNISICYSGWAWHYTHRCERDGPHPWLHAPTPRRTPKIAIAMVIDDFLDPDLRNATIENKIHYARRWGYHPHIPDINQVRASVPGLPVAWGKFPLIKRLFKDYEYVLMIDADAVFLRDDIGLHAATQLMEKQGTSLLISNDLNGPNSGIFMMRRGDWANDFLDQAIASSSILSAKTALLPLRFENRAFLYLLGAWPKCVAVRRFDSLLAPVSPTARRMRRGVSTVDRCLINRRPHRATEVKHFFLNTGAGFDDIDDAFVGHTAGGGVAAKAKSMRHMLNIVQQRRRATAVSA